MSLQYVTMPKNVLNLTALALVGGFILVVAVKQRVHYTIGVAPGARGGAPKRDQNTIRKVAEEPKASTILLLVAI